MKQHHRQTAAPDRAPGADADGEGEISRVRLGRDFRLLFAGNVVSVFGSSVYLIVIVLYLKETTGSATVLGFYNFVALLPPVLLGPFAGALIDRWSRRTVLVVSDAFRGVLMLLLAACTFLPSGIRISHILVITALAGISHAFFLPAVQAIIPDIEPPRLLKRANSARAAGSQLSNLAGNAVGGVVFAVFGLFPVLVANGISFLLSALQESWISAPEGARNGHHGSVVAETLEGLRYLWRRRGLRTLVMTNAMVFLLSPPLVLVLPFVVEDTLGLPTAMVGLYFAVMLGGGIGAYILWGLLPLSRAGDYRVLTGSFFLLAAVVLAGGLFLHAWVLAFILLLAGAAIASINLMISIAVQRSVGRNRRARVFSLIEATGALSAPFAYVASGILIDVLLQEVAIVFFVSSALIAGAALVAAQSRGLRRLILSPA